MGHTLISCVRQHLYFSNRFATQISISPFPPPLCFLCLMNSLYRRHVSCMYNIPYICIYIYIHTHIGYPTYLFMTKEYSGPPSMTGKGQHILPFGLGVKEMKSRFCSRRASLPPSLPPSLSPVRNLTEFWKVISVANSLKEAFLNLLGIHKQHASCKMN